MYDASKLIFKSLFEFVQEKSLLHVHHQVLSISQSQQSVQKLSELRTIIKKTDKIKMCASNSIFCISKE